MEIRRGEMTEAIFSCMRFWSEKTSIKFLKEFFLLDNKESSKDKFY